MRSLDEQIVAAQNKLQQLKARQQRNAARRKSLESKRARKDETRKKILVGAVVLAKVERGILPSSVLAEWLSEALTREDDRALFGLGDRGVRESQKGSAEFLRR